MSYKKMLQISNYYSKAVLAVFFRTEVYGTDRKAPSQEH